jgi:hypothetical protein
MRLFYRNDSTPVHCAKEGEVRPAPRDREKRRTMEKITTYPDGTRVIHRYEKMTPDKRPQDSNMDGTGLRFETLEHHGLDCCPEAIVLPDAENRTCVYECEQDFTSTSNRPKDVELNGSGLRFDPRRL